MLKKKTTVFYSDNWRNVFYLHCFEAQTRKCHKVGPTPYKCFSLPSTHQLKQAKKPQHLQEMEKIQHCLNSFSSPHLFEQGRLFSLLPDSIHILIIFSSQYIMSQYCEYSSLQKQMLCYSFAPT